MCLRSDVPFDPASQNQILSAYKEWQQLGVMIDSWQVGKLRKNHMQLVKVLLFVQHGQQIRHANITQYE